MKRTLSIVLSIIMVMMLVTACSGKQDAPQSSTPESRQSQHRLHQQSSPLLQEVQESMIRTGRLPVYTLPSPETTGA